MPAIGGSQPITVQYLDHSNERKSLRVYAGEITAVSLPGLLTQIGAFTTALDAVTLGTRSKVTWGEETVVSNLVPAAADAQVETELLVKYMGNTSEQPFSFRLPTVDYTAFNFVPNTDEVVFSGAGATAATLALVTAFEALAKNPTDEAEGVVVTGMRVVR